jgi:hypothetical protein
MTENLDLRSDIDVPADLPDDIDEAALRRMDGITFALDDGIRVPGIGYRVGLDPVVGILPIAGDAVTAAASLAVVVQAALVGVGRWTLLRMLLNVGVDAVVGSVPLVGDLFDAVWKSNKRNLKLALADLETDDESSSPRGAVPTPADD